MTNKPATQEGPTRDEREREREEEGSKGVEQGLGGQGEGAGRRDKPHRAPRHPYAKISRKTLLDNLSRDHMDSIVRANERFNTNKSQGKLTLRDYYLLGRCLVYSKTESIRVQGIDLLLYFLKSIHSQPEFLHLLNACYYNLAIGYYKQKDYSQSLNYLEKIPEHLREPDANQLKELILKKFSIVQRKSGFREHLLLFASLSFVSVFALGTLMVGKVSKFLPLSFFNRFSW